MTDNRAVSDALRASAAGVLTCEAATELLLRALGGRFATADRPWVHEDDDWWWIEWGDIPPNVAAMSGGERRLLLIAASLAGAQVPESLGDLITGLDRPTVDLVLAALSHGAGSHEHRDYVPFRDDAGDLVIDRSSPSLGLGPLHPWPHEE